MPVLKVEPGERDLAIVVSAVFFGIQTTHGLSINAADALFFSRFGVESLPQMYMLLGIVAMFGLSIYAAALGRSTRQRFYSVMLGSSAVAVLILRALVVLSARWVYAVIWLMTSVSVLVTLSLMWTLAADVADARAAKRLYPLFASAGILGGIVGNVLTGPLAGALGTENLLIVVAAILAAVSVGVRTRVVSQKLSTIEHSSASGAVEDLKIGYRTAVGSPLLRVVTLTVVLSAVLFSAVAFRFSTTVAQHFSSESELASFLGWFSAGATAATFLVSLLVVSRFFARFGIVLALLLVAITYISGFALWLGVFGLTAVAVVRFVQWVVTTGLGGPATSALFNVFRGEQRGAVMAFVYAVPANIGMLIGGILLWVGERWLTRTETFVVFALVAVGFAITIWLMRVRYGQAMVLALRSGEVDDFNPPQHGLQNLVCDADFTRAGLTALNDAEPGMRRLAAEMLGRLGSVAAVDALCLQLDDPDVNVRLAVVEALGRIGASGDSEHLGARLNDSDPTVRAATVDVLAVLSPECDVAGAVRDQDPGVRARTAVLLANRGEVDTAASIVIDLVGAPDGDSRVAGLHAITDIGFLPTGLELADLVIGSAEPTVRAAAVRAARSGGLASHVVLDALGDSDERVRAAAVTAARAQGVTEELLGLLHSGTRLQQESALIALETSHAVAETVVEWALPLIGDATRLRRMRSGIEAIHGQNMDSAEYLVRLLADKEWHIEKLVVRAVTQFHAPGATELVVHGIRSSDVELRSQALEVIDTIGDKRVARALLPLLERHLTLVPPDINASLEALSVDEDPWIRALAIRCITDVVRHNWRQIVNHAIDDSFPLVREEAISAIGIVGGEMSRTLGTLSTLDRVLFLRRVELFASLEPEDLQTVAEMATEEIFGQDETIYRAGELGDEMLVVVTGRVRLTKQANGHRQVLGEYGEGDHVGELAVLRDAPRPADLEAASSDVRVLVIRGGLLRHLLADRPRVGEAMLASLAERLANFIEDGHVDRL